MSKRPCKAPLVVVHHAGIVAHIAQCLALTKDVLSLLEALPRRALDAPLVALRTLVATPNALDDEHWPHVCIEDIDCPSIPTVLTALPTFCSVHVKYFGKLSDKLRDASSAPARAPHAAAIDVATKWGHKITSFDATLGPKANQVDALTRIIRLCTGLVSIYARPVGRLDPSGAQDTSFLAAVLHAATHAEHVALFSPDEAEYNCGDWRPLLGTSNSRAFVSTLVDVSALSVLTLAANFEADYSFALTLLPRLVKLQELTLDRCMLEPMPSLRHTPCRLRKLTLLFCTIDDGVCLDLFDWASQSPRLETIWLNNCDTVSSKPVLFGRYLRRWIAAGVTSVTLESCELNEPSVIAIAAALCDAHRASPFELNFGGSTERLRDEWYEVLLEALATCTGVSIQGLLLPYDQVAPVEAWANELHLRTSRAQQLLPSGLRVERGS
ncbi:hypothetical protein SDRG_07053 [Saprolegnia diclina VS20]|uniref:F-box domain-containing protein n=1 Tax=Saprolegnia diclina (strain VS20) TaxID=1156394 RepID=T0QKU9_SAPDV|nr:hypothetical protein SDRG_07053 [Saprolegnia diclina VS20]EQC35341.1 hypothetical protein SDRG_07053 [Saprolegnia diclina VS20]|eukprot:XP_008611091.1 hypothetical protein SDRG_07053 [Saprolegnia diclina VS20]